MVAVNKSLLEFKVC